MQKKGLLSAIVTIVLCISVITGSTFALFTTSTTLDVSVTAGTVDLTAVYATDSMLTRSLGETAYRTDGWFANGGNAYFDGDTVVIERMTPGDEAKFKIDVTNLSNVNVQYRVRMISTAVEGVKDLTEALVITAYIDGVNYPVTGDLNESIWRFIDKDQPIEDIWVTVSFPNHDQDGSYDNQFKLAQAHMVFTIEAVQGNADLFEVSKTEEELFTGANPGYVANGIHNGEGQTIPVTTEAIGVEGTVTFANMTIDGSASEDVATILAIANDPDDAENTTIVLADGTKVIATKLGLEGEWDRAISALNVDGQAFTLIVDENARIAADGSNACAVLSQGGETNIILNGTGLIELTNGACGFVFYDTTVNMFVTSEADVAAYEAMIIAENSHVSWFVNGVFYK